MRRRHFKRVVLASCLAATALPGALHAQGGDPVQGGAAFLLIPVGGRAAALGQAAVGDAGTSESVFWNPAGLASLTRSEIAVHHAATFVSDNTTISAVFSRKDVGVLGITAYLVDFGSQGVVQPGGPVSGRFSPKNVELLASFATTVVGRLDVGVNYKLIQFRQDCSGDCGVFPSAVGTTHGVDIGAQYELRLSEQRSLRLGAALQHAGFKLQVENRDQADPLPTRFQVGVAYRWRFPPPAPDAEPLDARLLVDVQSRWPEMDQQDLRVGAEVGYGDFVRLRTGYAFIDAETRGPSVGIGVSLGRIAVDFSRIFFDSSNFDEPVYISLRAGI